MGKPRDAGRDPRPRQLAEYVPPPLLMALCELAGFGALWLHSFRRCCCWWGASHAIGIQIPVVPNMPRLGTSLLAVAGNFLGAGLVQELSAS